VRAADDDAPFSESMLEWLEEGDRMGDAPPGAFRPSGAHHSLESPRRRERFLIGGGLVAAVLLVVVLRLAGKAKPDHTAAVAPTMAALVPVNVPAAAPAVAPVAAVAPPEPSAAPALAPAAAVGPAPVTPPPAVAAVPAVAERAAAPVAPVEAPAPAERTPPAVAVAEPGHPHLPPSTAPSVAKLGVEPAVAPEAPQAPLGYDDAMADCRAQMTAGHIQHALTSCRQASDARPRSSEALTLLAEAEFTRGHTGVALRLATQATNANQNFADAYVIIGGVYQEKGRNAEARAAYEQYLALQPKGKHAADLRAILGSL